MDAHKGKKKGDLERELIKHADLIEDPNVKAYIIEKKQAKIQKEIEKNNKARGSVFNKLRGMDVDSDEDMEVESELEEEQVAVKAKALATVKSKKSKGIKKIK